MMKRLVVYANEHGDKGGRPYFALDGKNPVTAEQWATLRYPWSHQHGITNVWHHPPLHGKERYRGDGRRSAPRVHNFGKECCPSPEPETPGVHATHHHVLYAAGDVVWEPFGGLCSGAVAAAEGT